MTKIEKEQYQHLGAGTAILYQKGTLMQNITAEINNEKQIFQLLCTKDKDGQSRRLVIGGIQAANINNNKK